MPDPIDALRAKCAPGVWEATEEDLLAAGWADVERHHIPENWRDGGPGAKRGVGRRRIYPSKEAALMALRARRATPEYRAYRARQRKAKAEGRR